jgi:hypothetical protein
MTPYEEEPKLPTGLKTAEEVAESLQRVNKCFLSGDDIMELAESGYLPCWRWQIGERVGEPLFRLSDVRHWLVENLSLKEQKGIPFPHEIGVVCPDYTHHKHPHSIPESLSGMHEHLYSVDDLTITAVYFLIRDDIVVYVGQSTNVSSRVKTGHGEKQFDRAVCLPVPKSKLLTVEKAFIRALKPEYNHENLADPVTDEAKVLKEYGWTGNFPGEHLLPSNKGN